MFFLKLGPLFERYGFSRKQIADLLTFSAFIEIPAKAILAYFIDKFDKICQMIITYRLVGTYYNTYGRQEGQGSIFIMVPTSLFFSLDSIFNDIRCL